MTIQVEAVPKQGPGWSLRLRRAALRRISTMKPSHDALASSAGGSGKILTVEEFHKMLQEIAEGSENLPQVPTSAFSRESYCEIAALSMAEALSLVDSNITNSLGSASRSRLSAC